MVIRLFCIAQIAMITGIKSLMQTQCIAMKIMMESKTMYVLIAVMVLFAVVGALSTLMALLNFMWLVAAVSAVVTMAMLYGVDQLAEVIE
jgi:hypothetical protein